MCETDKGARHGKFRGVSYESVAKRKTTTRKRTNGTAKAVPKSSTKPKKEDAIWKSMDRRMFMDDERDYAQPIDVYEENERLNSNERGTRRVTWSEFKRLKLPDEPMPVERPAKKNGTKVTNLHIAPHNEFQMMYLQDAWMRRQASKRKKSKRK